MEKVKTDSLKSTNYIKSAKNPAAAIIALFVSVLLFTSTFTGCKKNKTADENASDKTPSSKMTVGFSIDTLAIERWRRDCDIFMNTVKANGAEVVVQNAGNNTEEQNKQIQYLINKKVKVIIIVAKEADSLTETIKLARSHGIPVIAYDRLILNSDISLYMTIDSEKVGEIMAQELYKKKPDGKWFCIYGPKTDYNMTLIRNGVSKIIDNTGVKITHTFFTDGWNYDLSYNEMARLLLQKNIPDAVICGNDAVANSVIQAVSEICPGKDISISGQDADIAGCQNIIAGKQLVTVYKPITKLAEEAGLYAVELAKGKSIKELVPENQTINNGYANIPVVWLNPQAVTKDNIEEVIIKSGFHTKDEIFR